jgi:isoaspartyl peptidase/L-asparaginase-like protein (Ntn-hydrolase superfamily)
VNDRVGEEEAEGRVLQRHALSVPAIVIHGGAGTFERVNTPEDEEHLAEGLSDALGVGWALLERGEPAIGAVVEAVASLEDSGVFNAGGSGALTDDGRLELDASVMDGATGAFGGICAATWPRNPVRAALALSRLGGPEIGPVLLAGDGADAFAKSTGLPKMVPRGRPISETGTVGAVAVDSNGHVAAATSTGGRAGQRSGRVGDSPIPGAGTWADDETVAVSATGDGEAFLVAGFSHLVDWELRSGATLKDAIARSLTAVSRRGGRGGAISVRSSGEMVCLFDTNAMARGWMDSTSRNLAVLRE